MSKFQAQQIHSELHVHVSAIFALSPSSQCENVGFFFWGGGGGRAHIYIYIYIYTWKNQPCSEKKDTSLIEPQKEDFDDFSLKKKILFGNYFIRV